MVPHFSLLTPYNGGTSVGVLVKFKKTSHFSSNLLRITFSWRNNPDENYCQVLNYFFFLLLYTSSSLYLFNECSYKLLCRFKLFSVYRVIILMSYNQLLLGHCERLFYDDKLSYRLTKKSLIPITGKCRISAPMISQNR